MIILDITKSINTSKGLWEMHLKTQIRDADFIGLYGASGSGKTTILRMIAGLEQPDNGKIVVNDQIWYQHQKVKNIAPQQRKIGFMSQNYLLFPNMSVRQNLEYAQANTADTYKVDELLNLIELSELKDKRSNQLSGGQAQRVAFARAVIQKSKLLLLDEPFSGLDNRLRNKLRLFLKDYQQNHQATIVMASHDQTEVGKLAHRILHIQPGEHIEEQSPTSLFTTFQDSESKFLIGTILKISSDPNDIYLQIGKNLVKIKNKQEMSEKLQIGEIVSWNPVTNQLKKMKKS